MTFQKLINSNVPVLVDFSAEWCGPCKAMAPILKEVASEIGKNAKIVKIDVDKNRNLSNQLGIRAVPTFVLYKDGEIKWRNSGMQSAKNLEYVIRQAIDDKL